MKCCIAADGGGTKTDVVLFDEAGHILRRSVGPGGSSLDIGIMVLQNAPPVFGAAVEAMWDAGITVTEEIKANFLSDYEYCLCQCRQEPA